MHTPHGEQEITTQTNAHSTAANSIVLLSPTGSCRTTSPEPASPRNNAPWKWYPVPQRPTQTADQPSRADASESAGGKADPSVKMNSSLKPAGSHGGLLARAKRAAACNSPTSPNSEHKVMPWPAFCSRAASGSYRKTGQWASPGQDGPGRPSGEGAVPVAASTPATRAARVPAASATAPAAVHRSEPADSSALPARESRAAGPGPASSGTGLCCARKEPMKSRRASTSPEGLPLPLREGLRPAGPRPAPATGQSAAAVGAPGGPGAAEATASVSAGGAGSTAGPTPAAASGASIRPGPAGAAAEGALLTGATSCGTVLADGSVRLTRPASIAAARTALASARLALAVSAAALAASWSGPGVVHCRRTAAAAFAITRSSSTEPRVPHAAEVTGRCGCSVVARGPA